MQVTSFAAARDSSHSGASLFLLHRSASFAWLASPDRTGLEDADVGFSRN